MPQTKFVLQKALDLNLSVIVCINKIDRPEARPEEVIDEILELFIDLDANDDQLDCPFIFASAKSGYAMANLEDERKDMQPLFECVTFAGLILNLSYKIQLLLFILHKVNLAYRYFIGYSLLNFLFAYLLSIFS
jgi:predicted membrane GTPase involved in stress response